MSRHEEIFAEALDIPVAARSAFLDSACPGDPALRAEIEELLAGYAEVERDVPRIVPPVQSLTGEKPSERIGRYKLLEKIGEGGCGVVWMAEQEEPVRRRVALKVIKLGMDTKAVIARFEAERQALAMMDHPNIAKVLDAGATESGRPFFVMELVRGLPITTYCDKHQLPPRARLELLIAVCAAIQHAHEKGIIHRDIKPSNILITVNDGAAVPKVIDFGIAKATQGRLTEHTLFTAFEHFIGTPVYMSPEQAEMSSLEVDARSDVYSLGVLLYELLTGQAPFDPKALARTGVDEIRRQIREVEPPRPSTRWRTLTDAERSSAATLRGTAAADLSVLLRGDLDWIVMRCLEKERARRYDSATALAADLRRHLGHEPVVARPPSAAYVVGKFVRRHRVSVVASAAVIAALALGATASWWQARRAGVLATAPSTAPRESAQLASQAYAITQRIPFSREDLTVATALGERATDLAPSSARAWAVRAWVQACYAMRNWDYSARQLQEVQTLANRALAIDPRDADALNALYMVLEKQGALEEAEKIARRAIAAAPDNYRSYLCLGRSLGLVGRRDEARAVLRNAVERFPTNVLCRYELAVHYVGIGSRRLPAKPDDVVAGLEQMDAALAIQPFASAILIKANTVAAWRGDLVSMRAELDRLATMPLADRAEDRAVFVAMWGGLLERRPDRVLVAAKLTARSYFEDGVVAGPKAWGTALAYRLEGKEGLALQEWNAAETTLRQRLQDPASNPPDKIRLAATLAWLGRLDEAAQTAAPVEAAWREDLNPPRARLLAQYYAARGEAAKAVPYLRQAINYNTFLTVHTLPIDPWWDKLRGQPEFDSFAANPLLIAPEPDRTPAPPSRPGAQR